MSRTDARASPRRRACRRTPPSSRRSRCRAARHGGGGGWGLVVALGESSLCMLSLDRGAVLAHKPPPRACRTAGIADFTADGFADVIIPCAGAHLGVRVAPGSGALLRRSPCF